MPPPSSEYSPNDRNNPSPRRQVRPRPQGQVFSWNRNRLNEASAQMVLDVHLSSGAYFPDFDPVGDLLRYNAGSSQESDSDEMSSSLSESSSSSQQLIEGSALSVYQRLYGAQELQDLEDVARYLPEMADDSEMLSDDSNESHGATNSEDNAGTTALESARISGNSPRAAQDMAEDHESEDGLSSGSELPASPELLLSYERDNTTNENTLSDSHHHAPQIQNPITDGVPLRRQNAIRRGASSSPTAMLEKRIGALKKSLKSVLRAIKSHDPSFGNSPLFANHRIWDSKIHPVLQSRCPYHGDSSLEADMNAILISRQTQRLWKDSRLPNHRKEGNHERSGSHVLKRKCGPDSRLTKKRKKEAAQMLPRENNPYVRPNVGETIWAENLSNANKEQILNGFHSSFLRSGSKFSLAMDSSLPAWDHWLELDFLEVCQKTAQINGIFQSMKEDDDRHLHVFQKFMNLVMGDVRMDDGKLIRDVLEEMFSVFFALPSDRKRDTHITIPFVGTLINFKENDLRFLDCQQNHGSCSRRNHNDRIRFQLGEWLKVRPFSHLSETFFMNQLRFAIRCLKSFSKIPRKHQKAVYDFCKKLVDESWMLTKDFESIRRAKIPVIDRSFAIAQDESSNELREGKCPHLGDSSFTRKWNSEISDKLGNFVSCADSQLLNLQLNYVLFTVEIDVYAAMNSVLKTLSKVSAKSEHSIAKLQRYLRERTLAPGAGCSTLVCSLDRKTGRLEMSKARSETDFKIPVPRRRYFSARGPSYTAASEDSMETYYTIDMRQHSRARYMYHSQRNGSTMVYGVPMKGHSFANFWKDDDEHLGFQ